MVLMFDPRFCDCVMTHDGSASRVHKSASSAWCEGTVSKVDADYVEVTDGNSSNQIKIKHRDTHTCLQCSAASRTALATTVLGRADVVALCKTMSAVHSSASDACEEATYGNPIFVDQLRSRLKVYCISAMSQSQAAHFNICCIPFLKRSRFESDRLYICQGISKTCAGILSSFIGSNPWT